MLLNDRELDFLLYEFLNIEQLLVRKRYQEHSRETFNAVLDTARTIATDYYANHNVKGDANEPSFDGERVEHIAEIAAAWDVFAGAGFLSARYDFADGGMQLPEVVLRAAMAYFNAANFATTAYPFLTLGVANLIHAFGSDEQKKIYLPILMDGSCAGTMALTEAAQGSTLADIKTRAEPRADGSYRLYGQKVFISGGEQSFTKNILHMVLARVKGAPAGIRGISLFIVPKFLTDEDGNPGKHNDVKLAGLLHKMGYRNVTTTILNFGEAEGAVAYLVGEVNKGLHYMFEMMNEARIGVGLGAACVAYQAYNYSLEYARQRRQGRLPSCKDPDSKQVLLIEHADVKRILLEQRAYCEGALALCLYGSALYEDTRTAPVKEQRSKTAALLDLLTPIIKAWSSKYCLKGNELALQILGGAGYTRDHPVEQYYRDQRINPIHEGVEIIHALDLLSRKVPANDLSAFISFKNEVGKTVKAAADIVDLQPLSRLLQDAIQLLDQVTQSLLALINKDKDAGLANVALYLDMFGRIVVAWIWLRQSIIACEALTAKGGGVEKNNFYHGKLQTARYYLEWELPQINTQAALLKTGNGVPFEMQDAWF